MFLIVGLGNPEEKYSNTRHNMGFDVVSKLASKYDVAISRKDFDGLYGTGYINEEKVIIVKPQTYMNLSGICIKKYKNFFKIEEEKILVIYDDFELEEGTIRIRKNGGAGTHNGMKSVVEEMGTEEIIRLRVGIGKKEEEQDLVEYVIGKLSEEEYKKLEVGIDKAVVAIEEIIKNGIQSAMNLYN